jgi:predicted kinase
MTTPSPRAPLRPEEDVSLGSDPPAAQGAIHLLLGPVGAGKSTLALELAREHRAVRLTLDEWMVRLFSEDRPGSGVVEWYRERARRTVSQIWAVTTLLVERGIDVVLELGLIVRAEREGFYVLVRHAGLKLTIHVVDAPRDVRRERVLERNRSRGATFSMVVPEAIFELASDLWEPPDAAELAEWG